LNPHSLKATLTLSTLLMTRLLKGEDYSSPELDLRLFRLYGWSGKGVTSSSAALTAREGIVDLRYRASCTSGVVGYKTWSKCRIDIVHNLAISALSSLCLKSNGLHCLVVE
jgi:hypothetical protein